MSVYCLLALLIVIGSTEIDGFILKWGTGSFSQWIYLVRDWIILGIRVRRLFLSSWLSCQLPVVNAHLVSLFVGRFILVVFLWPRPVRVIVLRVLLGFRLLLLFAFLFRLLFLILVVGVFCRFLDSFYSGPSLVHKFNPALHLFLFCLIDRGFMLLFYYSAVFDFFLVQWQVFI